MIPLFPVLPKSLRDHSRVREAHRLDTSGVSKLYASGSRSSIIARLIYGRCGLA